MSNLGGSLRTVDWASTKLEHFEKNFYIEDKRVSNRSEAEIEQFMREHEIKVCPLPFMATLLKLTHRRFKAGMCQDPSPRSTRLDSQSTS